MILKRWNDAEAVECDRLPSARLPVIEHVPVWVFKLASQTNSHIVLHVIPSLFSVDENNNSKLMQKNCLWFSAIVPKTFQSIALPYRRSATAALGENTFAWRLTRTRAAVNLQWTY